MSEVMTDLQAPASYKFVFCEHINANAERIAAEVQDCDVVALEVTGYYENQDARDEASLEFTKYVSSAATSDDKARLEEALDARIERQLWIQSPRTADFVMLQKSLLLSLAGSDKQIVLMDMNKDDQNVALMHAEMDEQYSIPNAFSVYKPVAHARSIVEAGAQAIGQSHIARERVMAEQLRTVEAQNPGAKIGAITGAGHTGLQHDMATTNKTERSFVYSSSLLDDSLQRDGVKVVFPPFSKLTRDVRFGKAESVDQQSLNRAMLGQYFHKYVDAFEQFHYMSAEKRGHRVIIDGMTDAYVSELLSEIDEATQEIRYPYDGYQETIAVNALLHSSLDWMDSINDDPIPGVVHPRDSI